MVIATPTDKVTANGNGVARTFSFEPVVINKSSDLLVVKTSAAGVETTLSEGTTSTTYSVSVASFPGFGSIDYPASGGVLLVEGETITMKRKVDLIQSYDLEPQGGYHADLQEQAFDYGMMVSIQQQEEVDRSLRLPLSYTGAIPTTTGLPAANKYLRVNAAATLMEWADLSDVSLAAAYDTVAEAVSLTAGAAGVLTDYARGDHVHLLPTVSVAKGGTGGTTQSAARTGLGLGDMAVRDGGVTDGDGIIADATGLPVIDGSQVTDVVAASVTYDNVTNATGKVLQTVQTQDGAVATGTTIIPFDNTIPQNDEGDEYITRAVTPKSASSRLRVDVVISLASGAATKTAIAALFRDTGADALAAVYEFDSVADTMHNLAFSYDMASPGTSSTTFKVRGGASAAGDTTFNGFSEGAILGGVTASSIIITEYMP